MGLLKVQGLFKAFGAIRAVDAVSFEVRPGEIYGLLGPNGAGKTTTISIVSGLLKPDAGEVFVAGHPFWSDPQKAKRIMGVVPQELAIYEELTGRENLEFWGRMAGLSSGDAKSRATESRGMQSRNSACRLAAPCRFSDCTKLGRRLILRA